MSNTRVTFATVMSKQTKKQEKKSAPSKDLVLKNDFGLTSAEMTAANNIASATPDVVKAHKAYRDAEGSFRSQFFELCEQLRKPISQLSGKGELMPAMRMNGREVTLLLLSLGEPKQRVTEFKRIVEMDESLFEKARTLNLTKVQTLAVARGSAEIQEGEEGVEVVPTGRRDGKVKGTPTKAKFHKLPTALKTAIAAAIEGDAENPGLKATNDEVPYELMFTTKDGRKVLFHVFVDQSPVNTDETQG